MKLLFLIMLIMPQAKHRTVILYTSTANDPVYREEMRLLRLYPKRLKERDMVIVTKLRQDKFMITLTGKDGMEKFRSHQLTSAPKLFVIVDAMPMRLQEMKTKR